MRGWRIMRAFVHPRGGLSQWDHIKTSRRELREGKLNFSTPPGFCVKSSASTNRNWWAIVNKTPWGIQRHCNHPSVPSHPRLFGPESSNNLEFRSGVNHWVTRRGTQRGLWWRKMWGVTYVSPEVLLKVQRLSMGLHVLPRAPRHSEWVHTSGSRRDYP